MSIWSVISIRDHPQLGLVSSKGKLPYGMYVHSARSPGFALARVRW
jgi:hypothetical protein